MKQLTPKQIKILENAFASYPEDYRGKSQYVSMEGIQKQLDELKFWISEVNFLISEVGLPWIEPLINYVDQEVTLEWWNANKKLTIYFSDAAIDYIRVWGANIKNEMEDGEIVNPFSFVTLWQWLIS